MIFKVLAKLSGSQFPRAPHSTLAGAFSPSSTNTSNSRLPRRKEGSNQVASVVRSGGG